MLHRSQLKQNCLRRDPGKLARKPFWFSGKLVFKTRIWDGLCKLGCFWVTSQVLEGEVQKHFPELFFLFPHHPFFSGGTLRADKHNSHAFEHLEFRNSVSVLPTNTKTSEGSSNPRGETLFLPGELILEMGGWMTFTFLRRAHKKRKITLSS